MLLALWAGFWDVNAWTGVTPPPPPPPDPGSGGGHHHHHHHWDSYHEHEARSDYYAEREKHLRRFVPDRKIGEDVKERFPEAVPMVAKRNEMVARAPQMPDLASLIALNEHIEALDLQIEKYIVKCDEEALLALLL